MRIGQGFDVHRLIPGDGLVLGGVWIDCSLAVVAHSDGDVLLHAIMDGLLGALALGDIGQHFPDTDPAYSGADSATLTTHVMALIKQRGFKLGNLDATIIAQAPKISPHSQAIRERVAGLLDAELDQISIKATTTEKLGFTGRAEGLAVQVALLLQPT